MCDDVVLWDVCGFFRHDRRTAPKFGTHVRIDTLTLNKKFDPPHPRGFRGLNCLARLALARERTPSVINNSDIHMPEISIMLKSATHVERQCGLCMVKYLTIELNAQ